MTVVGIDLGNLNTVVSVARRHGIDVICNEVGRRTTPTIVSFGSRSRHLGESGKSVEIGNCRNTIHSIKRLLGLTSVPQQEKKYFTCSIVDDQEGFGNSVSVSVEFLNEKRSFTTVQLLAMYLGKIKNMAEKEIEVVQDVVIGVPSYYGDKQRRLVHDAAKIAGLNVLRLVNDTTASALAYAIPKCDLPEAECPARNVAFVDIGESCTSVSIVSFSQGKLVVKSTCSEPEIGGRSFDWILAAHFVREFEHEHKICLDQSPKGILRIVRASEKLKIVLSANPSAMFSVENVCEDLGINCLISRGVFEEQIGPLVERIKRVIYSALEESQLSVDELHSVELVGGSTRIPMVKKMIEQEFGTKLSNTLNQDEVVSCGCTFMCALLSPTIRVKEFSVIDFCQAPVTLKWGDEELRVFSRGDSVPSTKLVTLPWNDSVQVFSGEALDSMVGVYRFERGSHDSPTISVKVRLNPSEVFSVEEVFAVEKIQQEDGTSQSRKIPIGFQSITNSQTKEQLDKYIELELQMIENDKLVLDTDEAKNQFEGCIYEERAKLDSEYLEFVGVSGLSQQELHARLRQDEEWLYSDEGCEATKSVYVAKYEELRKLFVPILEQIRQWNLMVENSKGFRVEVSRMEQEIQDSSITEEQKQALKTRLQDGLDWLDEFVAHIQSRGRSVPISNLCLMDERKQELIETTRESIKQFEKAFLPPPVEDPIATDDQ